MAMGGTGRKLGLNRKKSLLMSHNYLSQLMIISSSLWLQIFESAFILSSQTLLVIFQDMLTSKFEQSPILPLLCLHYALSSVISHLPSKCFPTGLPASVCASLLLILILQKHKANDIAPPVQNLQ
jgi:hypothetical protein